MNMEQYTLKAEDSLMVYEFLSEGPKGKIPKLVKFSKTNTRDLFNLAFGDKDLKTGNIDDLIISNNGDSEKVLATVVATVYAFTDKHPEAWIYATGSTLARTRLYRMGITKYIVEIRKDFEVLGMRNNAWYPFRKNVEYVAFLVRRKK
jgi:hypothetical protein